ncbi:GRAM domain-containing protein [Artemisia annua]|uniref:GRAM domain-containing protein n=1 Tax=Artemisia annua TaxID=35608 RepID=A0A2U1NZP0_ARTAN|nr:GRAM domain-containing protein [Artemisia annua]
MATYTPSTLQSTSFGEAETQFSESETVNADEWNTIDEPDSDGLSSFLLEYECVIAEASLYQSFHEPDSDGLSSFLLEYECVIAEASLYQSFHGHGVLVNNGEAGTVLVTNFRLLFLSEGSRDVIALGTIPLATIEKFNKIVTKQPSGTRQPEKTPTRRLLQVVGKDMRIIIFAFRSQTKHRRAIFGALLRWTKPTKLWDLYAFTSGSSRYNNTNPKVRLINEYYRLLGMGSVKASINTIEDGLYKFSNDWWRISDVNSSYNMCTTYPFALLVPKFIRDTDLLKACTFRARCRLPVISWCDRRTGAVLARSSQPLVGLMMNMRSNADENLVGALCTRLSGEKEGRRKLYIADARPRKNALANGAMGGGSESSSNYFQCEIVFFGIDNIHAMRESLVRLRDYLDTHGTKSSDGVSSFLRNGGWTWGGGNLSSMSASVSTLGDSGWLQHIQNVLAGSAWIAARVALESASMLVHCSDGWDRTSQLVALASLLLDPYYRTINGFQALVEKDWLAFGHPFAERAGLPSFSGSDSMPLELSRNSSSPNITLSSMRLSSVSFTSQSPVSSNAQTSNHYSPIFLQARWVDCVSQLLRMYPFAFEYSSAFLVDFLDLVLSCRFGNFMCNNDNEREKAGVFEASECLWMYMADMRAAEGSSHVHYNPFYDPSKHDGPLLPPAAALAPTLWPQFHLRWSCPCEAQSSQVETQCRNMMDKYSELQKAKDLAESNAREIATTIESLTVDLHKENQVSNSAVALAKKANRENSNIKRAMESFGCKVHVSDTPDIENHPAVKTNMSSSTKETTLGSEDIYAEKTDLSVSIAVTADDNVPENSTNRICESLCPLWARDGGCRWPDADCAQLRSQFIGLKANYDAFDRLTINDSYFQPE